MVWHDKIFNERGLISSKPYLRPYGVRISFRVDDIKKFANLEGITALFNGGEYATIKKGKHKAPWVQGEAYVLELEGFSDAAKADSRAQNMVQGLLWMSVRCDVGLHLDYYGHKPYCVYDRTISEGLSFHGVGYTVISPRQIIDEISLGYDPRKNVDNNLLLSMEIYCSSLMESNRHVKFLLAVSSIEPLLDYQTHGSEVSTFVDDLLSRLRVAPEIPGTLKDSLAGQIQQLKKESIRRALIRYLKETLPEDDYAVNIMDEAYSLRSQIIHDGTLLNLDTNLEEKANDVF